MYNIGNLGYEPLRWTNNGTAGNYWINTPLQNGDHVFGSSILMGAVNTPAVAIPIGQQMRLFCDISANIVNPAFMDSFGNLVRLGRDSDFNVYNAESTTLQMGEVISIYTNITSTLHWVKRAIATNLNTAADGVVVHNGGIPAGSAGRIMRLGRTELPTYINTSYCTPGQNLYLSSTVAGGFTNVSPYVDPNAAPGAFSQPIGKVNMIGVTNGQMTVLLSGKPDILGGLLPSAYAKYANPAFSVDAFKLTNSATAQFSLSGVAAGTTNTYVLPVSGGLLASYTDIQLVPVSVSVGEIGGVGIGRAVYQSGSVSGRPQVRYADRSDSTKLPVIGITMSAGNFGDVIQVANFGPLSGVDTSSFATNDLIYLGTNGFMSGQSAVSTDFEYLLGTCLIPGVSGSMLVNMHSYIEDGAFSGSMRFTIKNGSTATNATANVYVLNNAGDAMRIGIRGTNSFRGQAAYVVSSANGPTYYAAAHKKSHIFDIDMTDSGNDYVHLSWPMMALVPQNSVYSNAFLGIGTTNPLAMLHVMGSGIFSNSMTAYQSFRGKTGAYGSAELATYDDVTNLVTITSNALYSADTNLAQRITTETNRAIQAETGLQSQINNNSNLTTVASTNLLGMINAYSNALYSADTNLAQRITTETNRAIQAEVVLNTQGTNTQAQLTTETNRAIQAEAVIQGQVTTLQGSTSIWNKASSDAISATNGVAILNASTTTWNTAGITATWAKNGCKISPLGCAAMATARCWAKWQQVRTRPAIKRLPIC